MHKPASLTCIHPSQLDAWPKAASGQPHWLWQVGFRATDPGPPIIHLSCAGPVSLSWQGVSCTATGHLSSSRLFLHRAGVCCHISASKACFASCLCFKETVTRIHWHVKAQSGDVMARAREAAGPVPYVCHQPPGRRVNIYYNYVTFDIDAASKVVMAAGWYFRDPWFNTQCNVYTRNIHQMYKNSYVYAQTLEGSRQVYTRKCMEKQYVCVYTWYIPRTTTFSFVHSCLYMGCTWYKPVSKLFILLHPVSYLENANQFSECAKPLPEEYICHLYSHEPSTYHASVQESAFLYILGSYTYIHPKTR
jgi:hypothetical protein